MTRVNRMWIVWERQRRSVELARRLGCEFHQLDLAGPTRYPLSFLRTIALLATRQPRCLFVQNPSMILSSIACIYGLVAQATVVVDRHTTFLINKPTDFSVRRTLFLVFHRFTLRAATLTLVTNDHLAGLVRAAGGRAFVLPDPLPVLSPTALPRLEGTKNVLVVSSFNEDEPVAEVLEAARGLGMPDVRLYVSGRHTGRSIDWQQLAPSNVILTGFLTESDYVNLLFAVDVVVALTKWDHCMLCGCYEAVTAGKPLITSDKPELRAYFRGAEWATSDACSIRDALRRVVEDIASYQDQTARMRSTISADWSATFDALESVLATLTNGRP
ncbi:hypothetical protein BH09GEM1_BH09GEM1_01800 [soil metagenome]